MIAGARTGNRVTVQAREERVGCAAPLAFKKEMEPVHDAAVPPEEFDAVFTTLTQRSH